MGSTYIDIHEDKICGMVLLLEDLEALLSIQTGFHIVTHLLESALEDRKIDGIVICYQHSKFLNLQWDG